MFNSTLGQLKIKIGKGLGDAQQFTVLAALIEDMGTSHSQNSTRAPDAFLLTSVGTADAWGADVKAGKSSRRMRNKVVKNQWVVQIKGVDFVDRPLSRVICFFYSRLEQQCGVTWETEEVRVNSSAKALSLPRAQLPGYPRIHQENPERENGSHLAGWRP